MNFHMNSIAPNRILFLHLERMQDDFHAVTAQLHRRGCDTATCHLAAWRGCDWRGVGLVDLRNLRGFNAWPGFLDEVAELALHLHGLGIPSVNHIDQVPSLLDKSRYLRALAGRGVRTVPTRWVAPDPDPQGIPTLTQIMAEQGWRDVVFKPALSARAAGTGRIAPAQGIFQLAGETGPVDIGDRWEQLFRELAQAGTVAVQPFIGAVQTAGEVSFVFLDGTLSHAVRKLPPADGWVAHEAFAGRNRPHKPSSRERAWAGFVYRELAALYGPFAYARIDLLRDADTLYLLECELVIPRLFLRLADKADALAGVLQRRLRLGAGPRLRAA